MKKQYRVVVTTGTKAENTALELEQRAGDLGRAVRIKAKTGARYLLEEVGADHRGGPVRIQVRRQGTNLEIRFEGGNEPDLIIEDYYGEVHGGDQAIIGQGGDGRYYEYLAETQNAGNTVPQLVDGHDVVALKLGAQEVAVTGSRWATLAFEPAALLGTAIGIGLVSRIFARPPANVSVQLDDITGDDYLTAAETRSSITLTGQVGGDHSAGDIVTLTINGQEYKASVSADGRFSVVVAGSDLSADALKSIGLSFTASNSGGTTAVTSSHFYELETGTQGQKTALTIESITSDNIIDQAEAVAAKTTVNGKVTGLYAAGDRVIVRVNNKTFMAQVDADGRFSIAVDTADLPADADTRLEARITGTQGDTATASIDYGVSSMGAGTVLALVLDPITPDVLINAQEGSGRVVVTGTVTGDFTAGDTVTLRVDGKTTTGAVDAHGYFAIPVDGSDLQGNQDRRVVASVTGASGQTATAIGVYAVDVNPPSVTVSITGISSDSGVIGDFITNDSDGLTIRASLSAPLSAGEKLLYSSDNGATWIDISTSAVNATTVIHMDSGLKNTSTVKFKVVDVAGNSGAVASQLVSIDTLAPSTKADVLAISDNVGLVQGTVATGTTTDDTTLVVSGTLSAPLAAGEQVRIYDGSTYLGIATVASGATTWTFSDDRTLSHGQRVSYTARLIDWADNEGAGGIAYTATIDTSLPSGSSTANLTESDAIQTAGGVLTSPSPFQILNNVAGSHGYGKFSITREGVWTYTMDTAHDEFVGGQNYTDSITVATADGTTQVITVTITGTNDAAVITGTLIVQGDRADVVNLPHLLADGSEAEGQWLPEGSSTVSGQTYNAYRYSHNASLLVLIDQQIAQGNVHVL